MTFQDHKLNRILGQLYVFSLDLTYGEFYDAKTNSVHLDDGQIACMQDYEFSTGVYDYRVLKIVYDPAEEVWLALCFELQRQEDILS